MKQTTYDISFKTKYFGDASRVLYKYGIDKSELKYYQNKYKNVEILNAYSTSEKDYNNIAIKNIEY